MYCLFLFPNKLFHPYYTDYKIIESSAKHEGLIIERKFNCPNDEEKKCKKTFKRQPPMLVTLKDFKHSPYGEIYITAFEIWKDNKMTGIGISNFEDVCLNEFKYKILFN